jgi:transketolase
LIALYHGRVLRYDSKNPRWKERDRFILSKGQASPALYTILADTGFFDKGELKRFAQLGGMFGVHLQNDVPGVEITSGSLGHGFGIAAGIALGAKLNRELYLTVALLGDGECYEGSVWETAMFASHHRLNNLIAIVDRNYLCATDFTENLIRLESLEDKWASFGWDVERIDGHSISEIVRCFSGIRSRESAQPLVIIADTVKGQGIDSMCFNPLWHAVTPQGKEAEKARECLERWCSHE